MNKLLRILFAFVVLLPASCTTFKASGLSVIPGQNQNYTALGTFHRDIWIHEFLGDPAGAKLFNISADATDPAIYDAIDQEIRRYGGSGVIELQIKHKASFGDLLITWITFDIYAPSIVEISGTVVK